MTSLSLSYTLPHARTTTRPNWTWIFLRNEPWHWLLGRCWKLLSQCGTFLFPVKVGRRTDWPFPPSLALAHARAKLHGCSSVNRTFTTHWSLVRKVLDRRLFHPWFHKTRGPIMCLLYHDSIEGQRLGLIILKNLESDIEMIEGYSWNIRKRSNLQQFQSSLSWDCFVCFLFVFAKHESPTNHCLGTKGAK